MDAELEKALLTIQRVCEKSDECVFCPLYDNEETTSQCILVNTKNGSMSENINETFRRGTSNE